MQRSCPGCGARLAGEVTRCDLCGTFTSEDFTDLDSSSEEPAASASSGVERGNTEGDRLFCNHCGVPNPSASRFCNQCGSRIEVLSDTRRTKPVKTETTPGNIPPVLSGAASQQTSSQSNPPSSEPGAARRVGIIVGASILIIIVWYVFTIVIQDRRSMSIELPSGEEMVVSRGPLPAQFKERETVLRSEIESIDGESKLDRQRELVDLYVAANRFDLAGEEAEKVAEIENTEEIWVFAANLYYDWMEIIDPVEKGYFAVKSIAAYRRVLVINPENLDARTDMAIAYMYDTENPMLAIQETMIVLDYDSLHVNANFNRAIMLLKINRVDQALKQLEKVKRIVGDPKNPVYQRAEQVIQDTRKNG